MASPFASPHGGTFAAPSTACGPAGQPDGVTTTTTTELGESIGARPGVIVPTLQDVMPVDNGYVHKISLLLVPVAALTENARPAFHDSGAGKPASTAAFLAGKNLLVGICQGRLSGADILQHTIRGVSQSIFNIDVPLAEADAWLAHFKENGTFYPLGDAAGDTTYPYHVYFTNTINSAEAYNAMVIATGDPEMAIGRGIRGENEMLFNATDERFAAIVAAGGFEIAGHKFVPELLPDQAAYGVLFGMGVPGMGEARKLVLPEVSIALMT